MKRDWLLAPALPHFTYGSRNAGGRTGEDGGSRFSTRVSKHGAPVIGEHLLAFMDGPAVSLAARMSIAMVLLVMLTAAAVGTLIYQRAVAGALPLALANLRSHAGLLAADLSNYVGSARADVLVLRNMPGTASAARLATNLPTSSDARPLPQLQDQLAAEFEAMLRAKPYYLQIRLVGANAEGREIVRIDRSGPNGSIRRVGGPDLQAKGARSYVSESARLPPGEIYVSPLDYNREYGEVEIPRVPTVRVATPVYGETSQALGIVIINLDMRPILTTLPRNGLAGGSVFLVDEVGNYLINPKDPNSQFAFEDDRPVRIQDRWPSLAQMTVTDEALVRQIDGPDGRRYGATAWPVKLANFRRVTLLEVVPSAILLAETQSIAGSSRQVGGLAALLAAALAVAISVSFARPIRAMTKAVESTTSAKVARLPVEAPGEVGALARALARFIEREALLGAIVASSVDAILTKTLDGTITSWNPAAERLYGYSAEEAVGRKLDFIIPQDRLQEFKEIMSRLKEGEQIKTFRTTRLHKLGTILDVSLSISPVRNSLGAVVGASTIARDMTRWLADQERLRQLQAESAHASRINAVGQMAGSLAHELNQPLTAIVNYAKAAHRLLSQQKLPPDDRVMQYVQKAADQSQRAGEIVRRVRQFVGNPRSKVAREDIRRVVDEALDLVATATRTSNIRIERHYADDAPSVLIDRVQIQQVVANLVRNGSEAMQGSSDPVITITIETTNGMLAVSVADNGPGLSEEANAHLFEAFHTTKQEGMGVGLTISRSIIEAHGGKLRAVGANSGAVFRFTLPINGEGR